MRGASVMMEKSVITSYSIHYTKLYDIVYIERYGDTEAQHVIDLIKLFDDPAFADTDYVYMFDDVRNIRILYTEKDFSSIIKEMEPRVARLKMMKHAVVVENVHDTAMKMLFELSVQHINNYECKIFSTPEAALSWLKSWQ